MTTTPEQLQEWREEFHKAFPARALTEHDQAPTDNDYIFVGYLRAKQETEQAMKLAKFGAMVMDSKILMYHDSETITDAIACELLVDDAHHGDTVYGISYAPKIEATIKELLT